MYMQLYDVLFGNKLRKRCAFLDNTELQRLVEEISIKFFEKEFKHEATFNKRLRTTGGRYLLASHNIDINPKYLEEHGESEIIGIIKHELCHYHLHLEGKGYRHQDSDFKMLLKRVDAPRFCTPLKDGKQVQKRVIHYKCKKCAQLFTRKRRMDTKRYVCGKCGGEIYQLKKVDE